MLFTGVLLRMLAACPVVPGPGPAFQDTTPPPAQEPPPQEKPVEAPPAQEPPAPSTPQDTASRVEELLRRLSEQDTQSPVPGVDWLTPETQITTPPPLSALGMTEPRPPEIHLSRVSDVVEVARADGTRRVLQYWDSQFSLETTDEVRGSSKSKFIVDYPDGAWFDFEGPTVLHPATEPLADPRRVEIPRLDIVLQAHTFEVMSTLLLPGGNEVVASNTRLSIHLRDLRALEIRNSGPSDVQVRGPFLGESALTLPPGQLVWLPVFQAIGTGPADVPARVFGGETGPALRVVAPDRVGVEEQGDAIVLHNTGPVPEIVSVTGARLVVTSDRSLELRRAPLGLPKRKER